MSDGVSYFHFGNNSDARKIVGGAGMTENEKLIKSYADAIDCLKKNKPTSGYYMLQESVDMAVNALEEIEQYRAIGTPEECRAAVAVKKEVQDIVDRLEELKEEKAIGSHKVMIKEAIESVRGEADA